MSMTKTSAVAFPRISIEALKESLSEISKRDNVQAAAQFQVSQPCVFEFVVQTSSGLEEVAMRLLAMELFCRALQLQMERGA